MSVHDAEPNDVYVDAQGKLWRVIGVCGEPTVIVEEIEGSEPGVKPSMRINGGVSGHMWHGFKRIHRQEKRVELSEDIIRCARSDEWR